MQQSILEYQLYPIIVSKVHTLVLWSSPNQRVLNRHVPNQLVPLEHVQYEQARLELDYLSLLLPLFCNGNRPIIDKADPFIK